MSKCKTLTLAALVLIVCLGAKTIARDSGYRARADSFLTGVVNVEVAKAYDKLLENSPQKRNKSAVEGLKDRTSAMLALLGKPAGFEFVREQRYGDSVVRLVYIMKYDTGPIMWEFYFYKPTDDWCLINIEFGDKLPLLSEK